MVTPLGVWFFPFGITLSTAGGHWLITLVTSFTFALIGLLVPNLYRQANDGMRRSHNGVKFLNEFLGRHLIVYITYFMAISLTSTIAPGWEGIKNLWTLGVGLTICFYILSVYLSTYHEQFFLDDHGCLGKDCRVRISGEKIWKLCWKSVIMALILLAIGVGVAFVVQ